MDYYKILGVNKNATENEIKKSYYKLAKENHPDKFEESKREEATKKFQEIGEAYEILSNPEKRKIYDISGKEGLKAAGNANTNVNPFDIFSMFNGFNSFQFNGKGQPIRKNKETVFQLNVSLKEAYTGILKKLKITKKVIIEKETNIPITENLEKTWEKCSTCNGSGVIVEVKNMGNMMFQNQKGCSKCAGTGHTLLQNFTIGEVSEIIDINLNPGIFDKTEIRISNQGNIIPGTLPGDLLIILLVSDQQSGFTRSGFDLLYTKKILLSEALIGSSFKIKHLDDRSLYVSFKRASPNEHKIIKGEGIVGKGNLVIIFEITFPEIDKEKFEEIKKILPCPKEKIRKSEKDVIIRL